MWINDDTTWNLTAQRHQLSSDVMQLSSLGESQGESGASCHTFCFHFNFLVSVPHRHSFSIYYHILHIFIFRFLCLTLYFSTNENTYKSRSLPHLCSAGKSLIYLHRCFRYFPALPASLPSGLCQMMRCHRSFVLNGLSLCRLLYFLPCACISHKKIFYYFIKSFN